MLANSCRNLMMLLFPARPGVVVNLPAEIDWRVLVTRAELKFPTGAEEKGTTGFLPSPFPCQSPFWLALGSFFFLLVLSLKLSPFISRMWTW